MAAHATITQGSQVFSGVASELGVLHDLIDRISIADAETRFTTSIPQIFQRCRSADINGVHGRLRASESMNLATLCLYLQGKATTALQLTERHLVRLEGHGAAADMLMAVQPRINAIRLLRSLGCYSLARERISFLDGIDYREALQRARSVGVWKHVESGSKNLSDVIAHVHWSELAKCLWAERDFGACSRLAACAPIQLHGVHEYVVRCHIASGRYDEAIRWCAQNSGAYPWARSYAGIALIRGAAHVEARAVTELLENEGSNVLLRLAAEWAIAGELAAAKRFGRLAEVRARSSGDEVGILLSVALQATLAADCEAKDVSLNMRLIDQIFRESLHNPVRFVALVSMAGGSDSELAILAHELLSIIDHELVAHSRAARRLEQLGRYCDAKQGDAVAVGRRAAAFADTVEAWCLETLDAL